MTGPPAGIDPQRFQLIAPWEPDPRKWSDLRWSNKYGGPETYRVESGDAAQAANVVSGQTYRTVLAEYRVHAEPKSIAPDGKPAGWHGSGLLQRRPVTATRLVHVGKESNELDDTTSGVVHNLSEVVNEHVPEDAWRTYVLPVLAGMTRNQLRDLGLGQNRIGLIRERTYVPKHRATTLRLIQGAADYARTELRDLGVQPPTGRVDCCAAYLAATLVGTDATRS